MGNYPGGNYPGGNYPGGNYSGGNYPGGNLPSTQKEIFKYSQLWKAISRLSLDVAKLLYSSVALRFNGIVYQI